MKSLSRVVLAAGVAIASFPAIGQAQIWTNWTSGSVPGATVNGTLGFLGVGVSGQVAGYQLTNGTTGSISSFSAFVAPAWRNDMNFWSPSGAYTQGGLTAPPSMGLVQMIDEGSITITFSGGAIVNPYIAINSLGNPLSTPANQGRNTARMTFGEIGQIVGPTLVSSNNGLSGDAALAASYWLGGGCQMDGNTLIGDECSGVVQLQGTYTSLKLTGTTENWYGFTVGAQSLTAVPEPSTYALMALGMAGIAIAARRKRSA